MMESTTESAAGELAAHLVATDGLLKAASFDQRAVIQHHELQTMLESLVSLSQTEAGREMLLAAAAPTQLASWLPRFAIAAPHTHKHPHQPAPTTNSPGSSGGLPAAQDSDEDDGMPRVASSSQWRAELEREIAAAAAASTSQPLNNNRDQPPPPSPTTSPSDPQLGTHESPEAGMPRAIHTQGARKQHLLMLLRIIRNLCAAGPPAGKALAYAGLPANLAALIADRARGLPLNNPLQAAEDVDLLKVAAQCTANFVTTGGQEANALWSAAYPAALQTLALVSVGGIGDILAHTLLCVCEVMSAATSAELCSPVGASIMRSLLLQPKGDGHGFSWLDRLVAYLFYHRGMGSQLLASLQAAQPLSGPEYSPVTASESVSVPVSSLVPNMLPRSVIPSVLVEHPAAGPSDVTAEIIERLVTETEASHSADSDFGTVEGGRETVETILAIAEGSARQLTFSSTDAAVSTEGGTVDHARRLAAAFQVLRAVSARDDGGKALAGGCDLVDVLSSQGLVQTLLGMLARLQAITTPGRQPREGDDARGAPVEYPPLLGLVTDRWPIIQPYEGYRSDIVSVLANITFRRPVIQEEVSSLGGVEILLSQCQVDDSSPLVREWGLWAVRNLCEGSETARDAILQLKAQGVVPDAALERTGMRLHLDEKSGKLTAVRDA